MWTQINYLNYAEKNYRKIIARIIPVIIFVIASLTAANAAEKTKIGGFEGQSTDLAVSITDSPDPVMRGENVTYKITVNNTTAASAENFSMTVFISGYTTFVSFAAPNGFNCTPPPVGSTDLFNCTAATVAGNSTNVFTLVLKVDSDAGLGASLYEPVTIRASNDTNVGNNSAAETTDLAGGIFVSDAGGNYQTTNINTPFPDGLRARVTDGNFNPLPNVDVTFTAPSSGASGTFANGMTSITVTSNANGLTPALVFTANGTSGEYEVTATAENANGSAIYYLRNIAPMTFTVVNTNDGGAGSLRQAILDANDNSGDDTINFDSDVFSTQKTITLTSGEIFIEDNGSLIINGPGADILTISGGNTSGVFVSASNLILNDVKISNGFISGESGAGISALNGSLEINRCAFYNNIADGGGAISSFARNLEINRSTFSGNQAQNGGNGGAIMLGFFEGSSTTAITNSTFNGNTAGRGGAIYKGFPIFGGDPLELDLTSVTIAVNTATNTGGGVFVVDGNFNVINSIIAGNTGGDINGTISSFGYNLIQTTTNTTFDGGAPQSTDIIGVDPSLAPLDDNGGTTQTMALQTGSPVIDKGTSTEILLRTNNKKTAVNKNDAPSVTIDQRGVPRPVDNPAITNAADGTDIGAYEVAAPSAAGVSISGRVLTQDGNGLSDAVVKITMANGEIITAKTSSFGFYNFEDIPAGQTYVLTTASRRYVFEPRIVFTGEEIVNLNFTALP